VLDGIDRADQGAWSALAVMTSNSSRNIAIQNQVEARACLSPNILVGSATSQQASTTADTLIWVYNDKLTHQPSPML
jgi:hypothetical protein